MPNSLRARINKLAYKGKLSRADADRIREALEKQIPKKATKGKYGHTECACCGWIVDSFCGDIEQYPFCPNCGQAIDWSEVE